MVPSTAHALGKAGWEVLVEAGAGDAAGFRDQMYLTAGARIVDDRAQVFAEADVLAQVRAAGANPQAGRADIAQLRSGQCLVAMCDPLAEPQPLTEIAARDAVCFALELLPRITRAQSMDVLSSMGTITGYKAVLIAADALPRMFPMLMTAAGTITAAKVFVVGAGVSGLQAIATAKRLGAVVRAYDIRPVVKEQVESVGGRFVQFELETAGAEAAGGYAQAMDEEFYHRQRELMGRVVAESDVVITTAAVPGKQAPVLVTADMVRRMSPGSVIVDLAAERGGNCELTRRDETFVESGVTILGPTNLPATIPYHASEMYARNVAAFLKVLARDGRLELNPGDEIIRDTMVTRGGQVVQHRVRELLGLPPLVETAEPETPDA
jgi:H+-translocating NAD(P) transhydrogenase subunit alpha